MTTETTEQTPAVTEAPAKVSSIAPDELARISDDVIAALKPFMTRKFRRIFSNWVLSTRSTLKMTAWSRL